MKERWWGRLKIAVTIIIAVAAVMVLAIVLSLYTEKKEAKRKEAREQEIRRLADSVSNAKIDSLNMEYLRRQ